MAPLVLVYGQADDERVSRSSQEVLGVGRRLSDEMGGTLAAVFLGAGGRQRAEEAIASGADFVYIAEVAEGHAYRPELYIGAMVQVCEHTRPALVLMSHDSVGADLAPRLAFRLNTVVTTDCTDLSLDCQTKRILCTKPIYGGNVVGVFCSEMDPQMATIREKCFAPKELDRQRKGEIVPLDLPPERFAERIKVLERVCDNAGGPSLEGAEVIVCGGRGVGSREAFIELQELADILKGAVGGTRPAVEKGWINPRLQVGLTGVKVSPKLYIAIGVSGAIQHMAGVVGAGTVVAINRDPEANIFKEAHFGAVGDYQEIVLAFKKKITELRKQDRSE